MNSKSIITPLKPINKIYKDLKFSIKKKYLSTKYTYNYINANYLIFNERCSVVANFKDFLIYDDSTEFLRRYYSKEESKPRLNRILLFYETYSKIFPNYMILPESEYLYKNIRRKQKMIDAVNEIKKEEEENRRLIGNKKNFSKNENQIEIFNKEINDDIQNYNPTETKDLEDHSFENSISISFLSKKIIPSNENSFLNESKNNLNNYNNNAINDTNVSIETILKIMNGSKIYTKELKEGILIEENIKNKKKIQKENKYLNSPKKTKKFISKIINSQNNLSLNSKILIPNDSTPNNNLNKVMSTISSNKKENVNIINNYQNIIIPKGNTIININNNYFQYDSSNYNSNYHLNPYTTNEKQNNETVNTNSTKKMKISNPNYTKMPLKNLDNNKKKQSLLSPKNLKKKNDFILKSPARTNITTPKNNNPFLEKINSSIKQCKSSKRMIEQNSYSYFNKKLNNNLNQKNYQNNNLNLYGTLYQKKKKLEEEKKSQNRNSDNLKIKTMHKNKVLKNKKEKENILLSPKYDNSLNKIPFSDIRKKYKNFIKKNKGSSYISKRNSCENFLSEIKTKKNFKEKYGYTVKKTNAFTPNKSAFSQINKNDSTINSQKSIVMSPKVDYSNSLNNKDSSCFSPIPIRVNRKQFLENLKHKQNNSKKEKSILSSFNN